MPRFDMAIIITVEAADYSEAEREADYIAAGLGDTEQMACSAATFEHDNYGQRVLYLHPENSVSEN